VKPLGDTRPGWKVLRMLGAMLGLSGFDAEVIEDVRRDIVGSPQQVGDPRDLSAWAGSAWAIPGRAVKPAAPRAQALERIAEVGIYAGDPIVRRAPSLQKTNDAKAAPPRASMHRRSLRSGSPPATAYACARAGGEAILAGTRGFRGSRGLRAHRARAAGDLAPGRR
jgi:NADH-quinone oxidoreductase subunit G